MSGAPDVLPPEPAFPSHGSMGEVAERGMSLRDYFAAKAMQELAASWLALGMDPAKEANAAPIAEDAYRIADAMLKARQS